MKKKNKIPRRRNAYVTVMFKRHPSSTRMRDRRQRRAKDAKNSWQKEWE